MRRRSPRQARAHRRCVVRARVRCPSALTKDEKSGNGALVGAVRKPQPGSGRNLGGIVQFHLHFSDTQAHRPTLAMLAEAGSSSRQQQQLSAATFIAPLLYLLVLAPRY